MSVRKRLITNWGKTPSRLLISGWRLYPHTSLETMIKYRTIRIQNPEYMPRKSKFMQEYKKFKNHRRSIPDKYSLTTFNYFFWNYEKLLTTNSVPLGFPRRNHWNRSRIWSQMISTSDNVMYIYEASLHHCCRGKYWLYTGFILNTPLGRWISIRPWWKQYQMKVSISS